MELLQGHFQKSAVRWLHPQLRREVAVITTTQRSPRVGYAVSQSTAARIEVQICSPIIIVIQVVGPLAWFFTDRAVDAAAVEQSDLDLLAELDTPAALPVPPLNEA